jgi:glycosyltransferase involved in cell wall biosynthesis
VSVRPRVGLVLGEGQLAAGGVRSVCERLSQGLALRGFDARWLALERGDGAGAPLTRDGALGPWPLRRVTVGRARDLDELTLAPALEREALRWCAAEGLDLVHLQHLAGWGLGLPGALAARGVPVLLTLHDAWTVCPRGQLWHAEGRACERADPAGCAPCVARTWPDLVAGEAGARAALGRREVRAAEALESCARLLAPSRAARELLLRHGPVFGRVEVLPNPVAAPPGVRGARPRVEGELRLGVLGSVQPSKGVLELARVVERVGGPLVLEVHGPREPYHGDPGTARALEELARRSPRIELHGPYEPRELGERLAGLDAVAVPSLWEEFQGLVAVEARLAGLPVLVSGRGGLADSGGLVVGPTEADWEEALRELVAAPEGLGELTSAPASDAGEDSLDALAAAYRAELAAASQAASSSAAARPQP